MKTKYKPLLFQVMLTAVTLVNASALIIDNFQAGTTESVVDTDIYDAYSPFLTQSGLDPQQVAGGTRGLVAGLVDTNPGSPGASGVASTSFNAASDSVTMSSTLISGSVASDYFSVHSIYWPGIGAQPLDLSGETDLVFAFESAVFDDTCVFGIILEDSFGETQSLSTFLPFNSNPGTLSLSLSAFDEIDLSEVALMQIQIYFTFSSIGQSGSVEVSNVSVVPEPTSGILAGAGVFALALRRRLFRA